ncbi:hypothetical protein GcM1_146014 [Golovinomyces cichoracearum]|uniref:Uncharacterized protein n=1 Tax=Golovinomyces cichoracearum TaxID=62708 RepID=A0A420JBA8_9PEZI|nr:hypothetical protein GcM1_146014 [Golovinomyces cichoracearum]
MDEERQICQAPCLSDKIEEEVVQSLHVEIVYDSFDGGTAWGLVSAELEILNLSESLEHFSVVLCKDGRRSAKNILEEARTEVAEIEASRKRRHFNFNGPRIHPKIKMGSLKHINGRRGEGPLDYKSILANTMITMGVLEFCQASPDATKHFRHLATGKNKKRERKKGTAPVEVGKLDYPPERSKGREPPELKGIPKEGRQFRLNTACVVSNQ